MAVQDLFYNVFAYDPDANSGQGDLVSGAEFDVFAVTDLTFTTPLDVVDPVAGVPIVPLMSDSIGKLPDFKVEGDPPEVLLRSSTGAFVTLVQSKFGVLLEAGWSAELAQAAVSAGSTLGTQVQQAQAAAAAAVAAAEAAGQVPTDVDTHMVAIGSDPATGFGTLLNDRVQSALTSRVTEFKGEDGISQIAIDVELADFVPPGSMNLNETTYVFPNGSL